MCNESAGPVLLVSPLTGAAGAAQTLISHPQKCPKPGWARLGATQTTESCPYGL